MTGAFIVDPYAGPVSFMVPAEVPPQQVVREGDRVRILRSRCVLRVGYAKVPADFKKQAEELLMLHRKSDSATLWETVQRSMPGDRRLSNSARKRFVDAIAYALAEGESFGGPTRGVLVQEMPGHWVGEEGFVQEVRRRHIGRRYGPTGGWNPYTYESDYEPGGIAERRGVTVCSLLLGDFLASDLEILQRAPRKQETPS